MAGKQLVVGVLALQGDVREHELVLDQLGVQHRQVRNVEQLAGVDALIIPGGESSVIDKLTRIFGVRESLVTRIAGGMPVLGTCAGLILLANTITGGLDDQKTFGGLDVTVERNAFGSQVDSFETEIEMPVIGGAPIKSSFIRAPLVRDAGGAEVIARLSSGEIVGVQQGALVGISFHPEVSNETRVHDWWVRTVVAPSIQ
ncbi:MAG: pyridoxal 5'-phosphate synthase glutaminase subunit PdxT [Microbacteriaceae bacterium]